jgi:hypothetical protein
MAKKKNNPDKDRSEETGRLEKARNEREEVVSTNSNAAEKKPSMSEDIHDSPEDRVKLKPDEATIDLPDVKDIPGQEFIHVPRLGELADTTISSDDEEGVGIFDDDEEDELIMQTGTEADVTSTDRAMFENMDNLQGAEDDAGVQRAALDNVDMEGEPLNETADNAGTDLDISGAEGDDKMENVGAEDEENNQYSRGSDRNDNMNEGTP